MSADSDRIQMSYVPEATWGTTPSVAPQIIRLRSESFQQATETAQSQEIREDRQPVAPVRTGVSATGGIDFEWSFSDIANTAYSYDELFSGALYADSAWTDEDYTAVSATCNGSAIAATAAFTNAAAGDWIRLGGMATATDDGYYEIVTRIDADNAVIRPATLTNEVSANATIKVGAYIVAGKTQAPLSWEKIFSDLTTNKTWYLGCVPSDFSFGAAVGDFATGAINYLGASETSQTSGTFGSGSYTAAPTFDPMSAVDNVNAVIEGGSVLDVVSFNVAGANGIRGQQNMTSAALAGVGDGTLSLTGSLQAYYSANSLTLLTKYLAFTETSLAIAMQDNDGHGIIFSLPAVKFTSGTRVASGQNSDITADMAFMAYRDSVLGETLRMTRFRSGVTV